MKRKDKMKKRAEAYKKEHPELSEFVALEEVIRGMNKCQVKAEWQPMDTSLFK